MDPCMDLGPGRGSLFTVRSGKDVMPFRQGAVLTTYMVDYIPPALMPRFYGGLPGVSTCFADTSGMETKKYFQSNRNDVLRNRLSPKTLYGRLPCDYTPFPDVTIAQTAMKWRKLNEVPNIRPSNTDMTRSAELRMFHERCVNHRDYYLDKTNTLHPDDYFDLGRPYPYRCPVDERIFKIKRPEDAYKRKDDDFQCFICPPSRNPNQRVAMPFCNCTKCSGMRVPSFKLPQSSFYCDAFCDSKACEVKPPEDPPEVPEEREVLLV